ncbi:MAG: murein biosynthesis integral membrane protein MurJ [Deltaproteobacteria bacterium]|nr:murein biosynthesis integral membrane protein MurJ [Deltaproteobacteria bacterium]
MSPAPVGSRGLSRAAGGVGLAVLGSRLLGLIREVVFTSLFGAGRELDAFIAAFRIPNLLRDLFAEGALSAAFVSTFSQKLEREGAESAWRLANRVLNDLAALVGAIVVLGMIAAPWIVDWIAPGFRTDPGKAELTITLTRILFPFLLLVALAAVAMGVLNARSVFLIPASASSFFNLGSIVGGLAFVQILSPRYLAAVWSPLHGGAPPLPSETVSALIAMACGTLAGGALQLLVQVPALRRVGFSYRAIGGFRDPGVLQVLRLMGPATLGIAAVQINVVVNTYFASELGNGPVSWLNVAFRLMYLPIGMFGVALGTVALPAMARASARGDLESFRASLGEGLRLLLLLCLPAAAGLALLAEPIIALIYQHGRFVAADTHAAAVALAAYSLGLTGYAAIKILGPAFYALDDARTPMRVSLLSVAVNLACNWAATRLLGLGHGGLALSTSVVALCNSALLFALLARRVGGGALGLGVEAARALAATALMSAACWLWLALLGADGGFLRDLVRVTTTIALGLTTFYLAGRRLGLRDLERAGELVRRRFAPR